MVTNACTRCEFKTALALKDGLCWGCIERDRLTKRDEIEHHASTVTLEEAIAIGLFVASCIALAWMAWRAFA